MVISNARDLGKALTRCALPLPHGAFSAYSHESTSNARQGEAAGPRETLPRCTGVTTVIRAWSPPPTRAVSPDRIAGCTPRGFPRSPPVRVRTTIIRCPGYSFDASSFLCADRPLAADPSNRTSAGRCLPPYLFASRNVTRSHLLL